MCCLCPDRSHHLPSCPEGLFLCLEAFLKVVLAKLNRYFPPPVAREAAEKARDKAIDRILDGRAAEMEQRSRRAWLYVVAYREAVTILRRPRPVSLIYDPPIYDGSIQEEIRDAVSHLPDHLREAVKCVFLDEISVPRTALVLGIRQSVLRRRLREAMERLRAEMS